MTTNRQIATLAIQTLTSVPAQRRDRLNRTSMTLVTDHTGTVHRIAGHAVARHIAGLARRQRLLRTELIAQHVYAADGGHGEVVEIVGEPVAYTFG